MGYGIDPKIDFAFHHEDRLKATRDYHSNIIDVREAAEARGKRRGKLAGIREGELKARLESIEFGLKVRFGDAGLALMPKIKAIKKLATIQLLWGWNYRPAIFE